MIKDILSLLEKEEEAILTLVEVGEGVVLDAFDRIKAVSQKEYAEWQEGDERLRRMHEEHLGEYTKRIAELEDALATLMDEYLCQNGFDTHYYAAAEVLNSREKGGEIHRSS